MDTFLLQRQGVNIPKLIGKFCLYPHSTIYGEELTPPFIVNHFAILEFIARINSLHERTTTAFDHVWPYQHGYDDLIKKGKNFVVEEELNLCHAFFIMTQDPMIENG